MHCSPMDNAEPFASPFSALRSFMAFSEAALLLGITIRCAMNAPIGPAQRSAAAHTTIGHSTIYRTLRFIYYERIYGANGFISPVGT